jgi:hypothetical protein
MWPLSSSVRHPHIGEFGMEWIKKLFAEKKVQPSETPEMIIPENSVQAPWPIVSVAGANALSRVLELREERPGFFPVVVGDEKELALVVEAMELNELSAEEIIESGESIELSRWIDERVAQDPDLYIDDGFELDDLQQSPALLLALDISTGKPKPKVHIAVVQAENPWEVPAHLKIGGWNDCPPTEVHVAFFKSWFERYGATVVAIGPDTVEFTVSVPPKSIEDAMSLAHEQFVYCTDAVHQGSQSLENLAKLLVNNKNWYFWWD